MLSMILKNAYDGISNAGEKLNIAALGGGSIALLIIYLPDLISKEKMLLENSTITENAGALLVSILMLMVVLVYWIKKQVEKKNEEDE